MKSSLDQQRDYYANNPLVVEDRRRKSSSSPWVRSFACEDLRPLIICRGPIRKEAMDVCAQMGIGHYGILLSEKDSIVYTFALAPELRVIDNAHVHRVKDYTGATKEERGERIAEIIAIAHAHGYDSIFAGYGFMAEDEQLVAAIERAGLRFIGPGSHVVRAAGLKDEAKRTAQQENVSVTPGVDNATARTLLAKHGSIAALRELAASRQLTIDEALWAQETNLFAVADAILEAAYARGIDLYTVDELAAQITNDVAVMLAEHPGSRVRLKAIGGGGGKGQRILAGISADARDPRAAAATAANIASEKVLEVLSEVKATGVGDNKNILIELNIEQTRHNEIQLIGNGQWTLAMGGRDCSLQMHEQKLLEVSITREGLAAEQERAAQRGETSRAEAIARNLKTLGRMEEEAERFGSAVGLDSASTFECIVERDRHFFMEVNTRIQVEHRVSELCYTLRFCNPEDPDDFFEVRSLVECMVLLARHGARLPRPERRVREMAALEARLNATNRALAPHAGGIIVNWSDPIAGEIRDDQGISLKNPDTGMFMHYRLAGAYDSNVALLITHGSDRRDSYERLAEILRVTRLRGVDLETNLAFHYGLVHWFLARDVMAEPTTAFVMPYLTLVGLLAEQARELDIDYALAYVQEHREKAAGAANGDGVRAAIAAKQTLLGRVLQRLFEEPHLLSAWLSHHRGDFTFDAQGVRWQANPIAILQQTYELLNMTWDAAMPPAQVIWDHDHALMQTALGFYRRLDERLGTMPFPELEQLLARDTPPSAWTESNELWQRVRGAHAGFQCGLEVLAIVPSIGHSVAFEDLRVEKDLQITIPQHLFDPALQARMRKILVPPPATSADEIVAESGGMFYAQEAPDQPALAREGTHFEAGQPLYILEVMKMFNKVRAPFAGTIDKVLVDGQGTIVSKGQPLYKVTPDEPLVVEDPKERLARRRAHTREHLARALGAAEAYG